MSFLDSISHLGKAMKVNPGYLKLRKIRAAQAIAHTVSSSYSPYTVVASYLKSNTIIPPFPFPHTWIPMPSYHHSHSLIPGLPCRHTTIPSYLDSHAVILPFPFHRLCIPILLFPHSYSYPRISAFLYCHFIFPL